MILRQGRAFAFLVSPSVHPAVPRRPYRASGFVLGRIPAFPEGAQEWQELYVKRSSLIATVNAAVWVRSRQRGSPKAARSTLQKKADLFEEAIGSRLMLQEQMVSTG
jgi:hypothetical protein